jgi:hypothetical protein
MLRQPAAERMPGGDHPGTALAVEAGLLVQVC